MARRLRTDENDTKELVSDVASIVCGSTTNGNPDNSARASTANFG